jgi:aspartyl-tRNA(Asn)/glutamyl-tRNA(Gln) amidotransferase subunit A
LSKEKLPIGMQIFGKHFDESTILRVANAYEKAS